MPSLPFSLLLLSLTFLIPLVHAEEEKPPFIWIGAVTANSFTIVIDVPPEISTLALFTDSTFQEDPVAVRSPDQASTVVGDVLIYRRLRRFFFGQLTASTPYFLTTRRPFNSTPTYLTTVRTFPPDGTPSDVVIALSSCQYRSFWHSAFQSIAILHQTHLSVTPAIPFLMLHMGDLNYGDISENDPALYEAAIRPILTHPEIHPVFKAMPVVYMYDDHDYGANNADYYSPSRTAAVANYQAMVPAYRAVDANSSYHAFTVGRVRVIVTDLRALSDMEANSTMGLTQRAWFFEQLAKASEFSLVIWLSTKPWIGGIENEADSWKGYPEERVLISDEIQRLKVTNLIVVSGDAHMLAADDGSHSDYSTKGGAGFPVFQAAPLGNVGTSKGGPYSEGCRAYRFYPNQQFGTLRITNTEPDAGGPCIEFAGFRSGRQKPIITFRKCGKVSGVKGVGGDASGCALPWFPPWVWVVAAIAILWLTVICVTVTLLVRAIRAARARRKITHTATTGPASTAYT